MEPILLVVDVKWHFRTPFSDTATGESHAGLHFTAPMNPTHKHMTQKWTEPCVQNSWHKADFDRIICYGICYGSNQHTHMHKPSIQQSNFIQFTADMFHTKSWDSFLQYAQNIPPKFFIKNKLFLELLKLTGLNQKSQRPFTMLLLQRYLKGKHMKSIYKQEKLNGCSMQLKNLKQISTQEGRLFGLLKLSSYS